MTEEDGLRIKCILVDQVYIMMALMEIHVMLEGLSKLNGVNIPPSNTLNLLRQRIESGQRLIKPEEIK